MNIRTLVNVELFSIYPTEFQALEILLELLIGSKLKIVYLKCIVINIVHSFRVVCILLK